MDYRLSYTQKALGDLANIIGRIADDDPEAASRFGTSLLDYLDLLARFPRIGNVVPKRPGRRKLVHTPILVYYEIDQKKREVRVLHFRHAARKPPKSEIRSRPD